MPAVAESPRGKSCGASSDLTFWVPASFDPQPALRAAGLDKSRYRDTARYIVSAIALKTAYKDVDDDGYAHLHWKVLQARLPRDYKKVIDALVAAGNLDDPSFYSAGRWSKRYRLSSRYVGDLCKMVPATDPGIIRRYERTFAEWDAALLPIHRALKDNLALLTVEPSGIQLVADLPKHVRLSQSVIVSSIQHQTRRFSVTRTGRVNTPFTNSMKILRLHFRLAGDPIADVDIRCAQPALLAVLAALKPTDKLLAYIERFSARSLLNVARPVLNVVDDFRVVWFSRSRFGSFRQFSQTWF